MFNPNHTVDTVRLWGLKNPKQIEALLNALAAVEEAGTEAPELDKVTDPKQAAQQVLRLAEWKSSQGDNLTEAKTLARHKISKAIEDELEDMIVFYLQQLNHGLAENVETYSDAVFELPAEFSAEDVMNFSPEVFAAYQTAKASAAHLKSVINLVQTLGSVVPSQKNLLVPEPLFLLIEPTNLETYYYLSGVDDSSSSAQQAVLPMLAKALEHGAKVELKTPEEALEVVAHWEEQRDLLSAQAHRDLLAAVRNW